MEKIQKELEFLKKKCSEQDFKMRKDERIQLLEKQLEWFKKEALQLSRIGEETKSENMSLKQRCSILLDERNQLESQLIGSKKQEKVLKFALGRCQEKCQKLISVQKHDPKLLALDTLQQDSKGGPLSSRSGFEERRTKILGDLVNANTGDNLVSALLNYVNNEITNKDEIIAKLRTQVDLQRKEINSLKSQLVSPSLAKDKYEKFFHECVDAVKKDIERRKLMQITPFDRKSSVQTETDKRTKEVDMAQFQHQDRMKVMEALVSDQDIVMHIYKQIFDEKNTSQPVYERPRPASTGIPQELKPFTQPFQNGILQAPLQKQQWNQTNYSKFKESTLTNKRMSFPAYLMTDDTKLISQTRVSTLGTMSPSAFGQTAKIYRRPGTTSQTERMKTAKVRGRSAMIATVNRK